MQVSFVDIQSITPYPQNPRDNASAIAKVAASIKEFGWMQPIVVDEESVIIVGHTRYEAAKQLGLERVPVSVATGLSEDQVRAYRIADNRSGEEAKWDDALLKLELVDLQALDYPLHQTGLSIQEIDLTLQLIETEISEEPAGFRPGTRKSAVQDKLAADPFRVTIGPRRIDCSPEEHDRIINRVKLHLQRNGTLYGFVADMLKMEVAA